MFAEEAWTDAVGYYEPSEDDADEYQGDPDGRVMDGVCSRMEVVMAGEDWSHRGFLGRGRWSRGGRRE